LGNGWYGLKQVDGELEMPIQPNDEWFKKLFGKDFNELLKETTKEEIGNALLSVHLVEERTSLNDFTSYAHELGKKLLGEE